MTTKYSRLSTSSDEAEDSEKALLILTHEELPKPLALKQGLSKLLMSMLLAIFLACSAINAVLGPVGYRTKQYDRPSEWMALRRLYQYPGLEKLHRNTSSLGWPGNYTYYPDTVVQVDTEGEQRIFDNSTHVVLTPSVSSYSQGSPCPSNPDFALTKVPLVLQFRTHSIGVENCTLVAWFPKPETALPKSWDISPETTQVEIWLLEENIPWVMAGIDQLPHSLLHRSSKRFLQYLDLRKGGASTKTKPFRCPTHSVTTLEVACTTREPGCKMNFVQDGAKPKIGKS